MSRPLRNVTWMAVLCLVLAASASAAPAPVPGAEYSWSEFPDLVTLESRRDDDSAYPDWDPEALVRTDYSETEAQWQDLRAVVSCESTRTGYLSIIRYQRDGLSRVTHSGLPLRPGQLSSLTFRLEQPDAQDLTRLVMWQSPPSESWLVQLARHPNWLEEPVPDLIAQRWFSRAEKKGRAALPWQDALRPGSTPVALAARVGWPHCRATLGTEGTVRSKDCAVLFDGRTSLGFDEYGGFGQWLLDWSSRFELVFEVPQHADWAEAELQLYGDQRALYQLALGPPPEVTVNGWPVSTLGLAALGGDTQPFVLPVSQYLEEGGNHIVLRMGSLAGTEWLLDGIELWLY